MGLYHATHDVGNTWHTGVHRRRIDRWFANPGGALPVIKVEWAATVDPVRQYELPNASPARLRTIVTLPLVVDTHGFDREKLVLDSP